MVEKSHTPGFWPSRDDPFRNLGARVADWFAPAAEASVGQGACTIRIEVPGVAERDIGLSVHDGAVTVNGGKKSECEENGKTRYVGERACRSFSRSFRLPPDAGQSGGSAALKDGALVVSGPKKTAEAAEGARRKGQGGSGSRAGRGP